MSNITLTNAKKVKNDEFYTQYQDIQKEIEAYLEYNPNTFRDKVIYCNCDDPYESNFFRYFALNFRKLGLKKLITTSYSPSHIACTQLDLFDTKNNVHTSKNSQKKVAIKFVIQEVGDIDKDGEFNLKDIAKQLKDNKNNEWSLLQGNGDFRSKECIELLKQSDIVVTNPPFSLFREYVKQLFDYNKKFLIIGSISAITYKEIFPLIRDNKMWLGNGFSGGNAYFYTPNIREFASGVYDPKTGLVKFRNVHWFTNLDHGRRHEFIPLMTMAENLKFNKKVKKNPNSYKKYDNYDAIEVPYTEAIPSDYKGIMGVPISFLDRYNPEQFEILGLDDHRVQPPNWRGRGPELNGKTLYRRIIIKHKK
ncbi:MAG: putative adenine-specific methylase [Candidatus Parcubacteria bacterium]|nr:MAG: putative adenine-specific methylase [Candidatus Parcubacteria bacterium]